MNKKISIISFILLPLFLYGQQRYISKRYDFNLAAENGFNIIPQDSGYSMWCSSRMDPFDTSYLKILFCKLDSEGNLIQTKIYGNPLGDNYCGGPGKICRTNDNGYALAGSIVYPTQGGNVILYKFNHLGDSLWSIEYGDTSIQSGWQCKQTRDGGFIITGLTATYDYSGDVLLIKTDSNGVIQWEQHYGGNNKDIGFSIDTSLDGGFIIGGYTWSYGVNANSTFANAYVIKTDSLGNFEWQKVFGGSYDDQFWQIKQSRDSSFYGVGYYTKWDPFIICCASRSVPYIINLNSNGSTNWERIYGDSVYDLAILNAEITESGDLICSGFSVDTIAIYSYQGVLLRVSSQGDSLFYKGFRGLPGVFSNSYFYDVSMDNDKGYICTGYVVPAAPDTGSQDIWVLKLDSNGCEIVNCLGLSVKNDPVQENDLLVSYPIPFTRSVTMVVNAPQSGICELLISDSFGRIVKTLQLKNGYNKIEFDTSKLTPGLFFETLSVDKKNISSIRLVKIE